MQDIARNVARETAPWKAGQSWWVVGIEGIIALAIGVYIVSNPAGASDVIRFLIAVVLLVDSLGQIVDGFRVRGLPSSPWEALRGGVGATVAVLTLLSGWSADIGDIGARQMLAAGLLAYGILGILALVFSLRSTGFKIGAIIADVLTIVLGVLLLIARPGDTGTTQLLGVAAIAGGIALLVYSWMLRGKAAPANGPVASA
ncbi:MAG: HdeD family acid-resistance protein [Thermomicrobiales bacterium]